jgi:hypothetical protein
MHSSFSRMSALARDGLIKVIELQAVPRSLSTALGRCLNECGGTSVFITEPFNKSHQDRDVAAGHVIRSIEPVLPSASGPVIVVTKNMARYLSASVFRSWTDVCSAVVWCVRDPRVQISSLVTRMANDLLFGIGSNRLEPRDLQPSHLVMVTEFLQDSGLSTDFSKTGWSAIAAHYADCRGRRPSFVADGTLFSRVPDRFLRYLCDGLGVEFRARMINGWSRPFLNVDMLDNPGPDDTTDAWIEHAATSRGVEASDDYALEESVLPAALREHLLQVASPAYEMFMDEFYSQQKLAGYRLGLDEQSL